MVANKEVVVMVMEDILSEKPEDTKAAIQWAKDLQARREKSEKIRKDLLAKYTPEYLKMLATQSKA